MSIITVTISNAHSEGIPLEIPEDTEDLNPIALTAARIAAAPFVLAKLSVEAAILIPLSIVTVPTYRGLKRIFIDKEIALKYKKANDLINEASTEIDHLNSKKSRDINERAKQERRLEDLSEDSSFKPSALGKIAEIKGNLTNYDKRLKALNNKKALLKNTLESLKPQFDSMSKAQSRLNKIRAFSYQRLFRDVLFLHIKPRTWGVFSKIMIGHGKSGKQDRQGMPLSYHKQVESSWKNFRSPESNPFT